jgi:hypothetical protein
LTHDFSSVEYSEVATDNDVYAHQDGYLEHMVFLFKNQYDTSTGYLNIYAKAKSSLAPSSSTVYLQIYNRTDGSWETIDSESAASADTKFTLQAYIESNLEDYYDAEKWVSCRIYQLDV